jgi:hypothetical protein
MLLELAVKDLLAPKHGATGVATTTVDAQITHGDNDAFWKAEFQASEGIHLVCLVDASKGDTRTNAAQSYSKCTSLCGDVGG